MKAAYLLGTSSTTIAVSFEAADVIATAEVKPVHCSKSLSC